MGSSGISLLLPCVGVAWATMATITNEIMTVRKEVFADKQRDKIKQSYAEKGSRKLLELHCKGSKVTLCGDHIIHLNFSLSTILDKN